MSGHVIPPPLLKLLSSSLCHSIKAKLLGDFTGLSDFLRCSLSYHHPPGQLQSCLSDLVCIKLGQHTPHMTMALTTPFVGAALLGGVCLSEPMLYPRKLRSPSGCLFCKYKWCFQKGLSSFSYTPPLCHCFLSLFIPQIHCTSNLLL